MALPLSGGFCPLLLSKEGPIPRTPPAHGTTTSQIPHLLWLSLARPPCPGCPLPAVPCPALSHVSVTVSSNEGKFLMNFDELNI